MRCFIPLCVALLLSEVQAKDVRPNFVFLLTDDQDMKLGSEDVYTKWGSIESQHSVQERLLRGGTAMKNFFVNTPICCPSRTEYFTGRYFHNVRGVNGTGCMHVNTTYVSSPETGIFGRLFKAGYSTGLFGKVTNDQIPLLETLVANNATSYISSPYKYSDYNGAQYFNYNHSNGDTKGTIETMNATDPRFGSLYQTSQLGNRSMAWLDSLVERDALPFFLYLGPHAPHFPADPAPWYEGEFNDSRAPRTPNYNVESPDKTPHIRQNPPMSECLECWEDQHFRDRWRTLLSVDDLVEAVYERLERHGIADNTYFFYTSDHGFKLGQWRVPVAKQHPYETDIRVPFFVSGPGIKEGVELPHLHGNVDFLPTIMTLAGLEVQPGEMDGREFASLILGKHSDSRTAWLNEYESNGDRISDNIPIWAPKGFENTCGGPIPAGPSGKVNHSDCIERNETGTGNCYYFDSAKSNTFRALRRINATHDTQYIEYAANWDWCPTCPIWYEYYNVAEDLYQVKNLYYTLPQETRDALASELNEYYKCNGLSCP